MYKILNELNHKKIKYAEIGVDQGHTSLKVSNILKPGSEVHLYDFESK